MLIILDKDQSGWWTAQKNDGSSGKVPMNFLQLYVAPAETPAVAPSPQAAPQAMDGEF